MWVLCGRAVSYGEEASAFGCGAARELVHCVEIDDVSDGGELISSGVCCGANVEEYEDYSKSGVLASSASTDSCCFFIIRPAERFQR